MKTKRTLVTLGTSAALALGLVGAAASSASASAQTQIPFWGGGSATYETTDLRTGDVEGGNAYESPFGALMRPQGNPASCGSIERSTHTYTATCSGRDWAVQVDCSDGSRHTTPSTTGPHRVSLSCPYGTRVTDGGAYER